MLLHLHSQQSLKKWRFLPYFRLLNLSLNGQWYLQHYNAVKLTTSNQHNNSWANRSILYFFTIFVKLSICDLLNPLVWCVQHVCITGHLRQITDAVDARQTDVTKATLLDLWALSPTICETFLVIYYRNASTMCLRNQSVPFLSWFSSFRGRITE